MNIAICIFMSFYIIYLFLIAIIDKKYCEPKDTQYCEKINNFQIMMPPPTTVSPS